MKQRFAIYLIMLFLIPVCLSPRVSAESKKKVFVSIAPQKYFVESIGGEFVETAVIVRPGRSPEDYEPSPSQMRMMSEADIYFAVGVPFETLWLKKFSKINTGMKVVYTDAGIRKKPIDRFEKINTRSMDQHHKHNNHGTPDPHIWLSPPLVKIQAENILNGMISIDPAHSENYKNNYLKFIARINNIDKEFKTLFSTNTGQKEFLVFHPSWGYFADAYGLKQISIEIEGKSPKARELKKLIIFAKEHNIRLIFVQPQFSTRYAEIIANEINGRLIYADPLAENWLDNIRAVAMSIKKALK